MKVNEAFHRTKGVNAPPKTTALNSFAKKIDNAKMCEREIVRTPKRKYASHCDKVMYDCGLSFHVPSHP